jgi:hypothetical protein
MKKLLFKQRLCFFELNDFFLQLDFQGRWATRLFQVHGELLNPTL